MKIYDGIKDIRALPSQRTANLVSAGICTCKHHDQLTIRKNGRVDWSFFYCEHGRVEFEKQTSIHAGEGWLYPPEVPHHYAIYKQEHSRYYYVHFNGRDIEGLLKELNIPLQTPLACKKDISPALFEKLRADADENTPLSRLRAEYHLLYLFSRLCRTRENSGSAGLMYRVIDDMEHTFFEPYNAKKYADMLHVSTDRFHHLFKESVGTAPYAYFLKIRIENACELLEGSRLKIHEIARSCGFEDALYFTQAFKRHTGMTPSMYRKSHERL